MAHDHGVYEYLMSTLEEEEEEEDARNDVGVLIDEWYQANSAGSRNPLYAIAGRPEARDTVKKNEYEREPGWQQHSITKECLREVF
jgi:hypothetical protein